MKITNHLKELTLVQCLITLQTWYCRLNNQWNRLVKGNGAKYDWLRVPAVIFALATLFLLAYLPAEALAVGSAESHNIWVAYTVGDVSFIHSVLRAISMMMYGGGGVIQGAYRLAALLGIIWLIVRGIFSKDGLNLGSGLFVILFYMCFFVPQSTLHIEDMQTKKFYTMDKIPLGVSATLSVVSKIGKYLSESYEAVFVDVSSDNGLCSSGSMECNGYMGTLDMLIKARSSLQNSAAYVAINQAMCSSNTEYSSCDIEKSILNYMHDCTIHKVTNPNERFSLKNVKSFTNNEDTSFEMRYHSDRHLVNVYLGKGKTGTMTCKNAGKFIEDAFDNANVKTTIFRLASPVHNMNPHDGGSVAGGGTGIDNGTTTGRTNTAAFQGMMDEALTGLGGSSANSYEYLRNVIMQPLIEEGLRAGFVDQNMSAAKITLDTAIAQRDLQLAAESSMFATMIRPLSTFLEGFVLALTPIMPFIILISLNGFAICMKYLMVLLWIQLWAPALAICNMYVQSVARESMAVALSGTDITSLAGISRATPILQHWLAVGGMMGASVPVLTLFILSGSIYTFNSLATSMKGSDHFDEKAIQPDALKRAAYINDSVGSFNASSGSGAIVDGTQARFKNYAVQKLYQLSEQSAKARSVETANQYANNVANALSDSTNAQAVASFLDACADQYTASHDQQYADTYNMIVNHADEMGVSLSEEETKRYATQYMFEASVGAKVGKKIGGGASWSRKKSQESAEVFAKKKALSDKLSILAAEQYNTGDTHALRESVNHNLASQDLSAITKAVNEQDVSTITNSYLENQKALKSYQNAKSKTDSSSSSMLMSSNNIAGLVMDKGRMHDINNWLSENQEIWRKIVDYTNSRGYTPNRTGVLSACIEYALDHREDDANANELAKIIGLDNIMTGFELKDISADDKLMNVKPTEKRLLKTRKSLEQKYQAQTSLTEMEIQAGKNANNAALQSQSSETRTILDDDGQHVRDMVDENNKVKM